MLKTSSLLKAEQKQAVVGVLNTDASLSGSAVGVLADFGFSLDVEDFDLLSLAVIGICFNIGYDGV